MSDKYFTVNIRAYLDKDEPTYIGEESLYDLLSDFSCPKNPDEEYFLLHNAIEFTKKEQSITYLVFDAEDFWSELILQNIPSNSIESKLTPNWENADKTYSIFLNQTYVYNMISLFKKTYS